jgi:hypothetical protein
MSTTTITVPTPPLFDEARLAVAGFLARYSGPTRKSYKCDLRRFFAWCASVTRRSQRQLGSRNEIATDDDDASWLRCLRGRDWRVGWSTTGKRPRRRRAGACRAPGR